MSASFVGLHIDRRHHAAAVVGDKGGLTVGSDRHPEQGQADRDVGGILVLISRRLSTPWCRRSWRRGWSCRPAYRHPDRHRADGDVTAVVRLHRRRHRVTAAVSDEHGLAVRRDRHPSRTQADEDVGGVLGPVLTSIVDTVR